MGYKLNITADLKGKFKPFEKISLYFEETLLSSDTCENPLNLNLSTILLFCE